MECIRQHFLTRFLHGLLAVTILNLSVDAPDLYSDAVKEDLSYNDMESAIELVLEKVLKIENAIPEHDDSDNNSVKCDKQFNLYLERTFETLILPIAFNDLSDQQLFFAYCFYSRSAISELFQPPEA